MATEIKGLLFNENDSNCFCNYDAKQMKGMNLSSKVLRALDTVVTPDTLLAWQRKLELETVSDTISWRVGSAVPL